MDNEPETQAEPQTEPQTEPQSEPQSEPPPEPTTSIPSDIDEYAIEEDFQIELQPVDTEKTDDDGIDYTPLYSHEDSEKQAAYREYKLLENDIKHQNKMMADMKTEIQKLKTKSCLTKDETNNLKIMYDCWQREKLKLEDLIKRAINLQNVGSKRHYREFPVVTTFDEDNIDLAKRTYETLHSKTFKAHENSGKFRASAGASSDVNTSCCYKESKTSPSPSEERMLIKEISAVIKDIKCLQECKHHKQKGSLAKIKSQLKCIQQKVSKLNEDFYSKENLTDKPNQKTFTNTSPCNNMEKTDKFRKLKDSYLFLLTEFNKKDDELKNLTKKLRSSCSRCTSGAAQGGCTSADESELHLLRNRIDEMNEEQVEFKCLMKEQSLQLEEYRNKYLTAQQKVEEQCVLIDKINMNNKCIEKQINKEIKDIRAKFQERLADLLQFPKLLENEQIKLSQVCKEKEEIETKLVIVCKELRNLKSKQQTNTAEDCKPQLIKCQQELSQAKKVIEDMQQQRDMFCEQLKSTTEDLNTIRSESARIIARTKERSEFIRQQQQEQIDCLEKQLAQCRATANLSVSDREHVIKEMQGQLNTLSYSFDAAQKQIKTLRNHIAFMSNEKSFPIKC